jgi:hypothetical protein
LLLKDQTAFQFDDPLFQGVPFGGHGGCLIYGRKR